VRSIAALVRRLSPDTLVRKHSWALVILFLSR